MNVVLDDFLIFLVSLFAISSPLVTVPIFISLTRGLAPAERRRIPRRTATGAFITFSVALCLLFIHPPAHGSEVSPAARNTLDSARIPRGIIYDTTQKA